MFIRWLFILALVVAGWIIYRRLRTPPGERKGQLPLKRGQKRTAWIRGLATFLLASTLLGLMVKVAFSDPVASVSGYADGGGKIGVGKMLLVFSLAGMAGLAEGRRCFRAGQKSSEPKSSRGRGLLKH